MITLSPPPTIQDNLPYLKTLNLITPSKSLLPWKSLCLGGASVQPTTSVCQTVPMEDSSMVWDVGERVWESTLTLTPWYYFKFLNWIYIILIKKPKTQYTYHISSALRCHWSQNTPLHVWLRRKTLIMIFLLITCKTIYQNVLRNPSHPSMSNLLQCDLTAPLAKRQECFSSPDSGQGSVTCFG